MTGNRTINSLQAGRGLAALAVVANHSAAIAHDFGRPFPGYWILWRGYIGVDFFFVLSGFIIFHSTVGRNRRLSDYALARFRRVFLPYWPIGIAVALVYSVVATAHHWSWLPTLTLAPMDAQPALPVAWTLQHEILFYTLFGLFFYADMLWVGMGAWFLVIIVSLLNSTSFLLVPLARPEHLPFRLINLEFFFGMGAAMLFRSGKAPVWLIGLGVLVFTWWIALGGKEEYRLLVGLAFALIVAPVAHLENEKLLDIPRTLVILGAASYSLYLVHMPTVSICGRLFRDSWWAILPSGIIASLAGGFAYHFAVERRVIQKRANPEVFKDG